MCITICKLFANAFDTQMTFIKLTDSRGASAAQQMAACAWLGGMEEGLREALLAGSGLCDLEQDDMLFVEGQQADYFYLVLSGRMDTLRLNSEGDEHIIQHVRTGNLLAPIVMFMSNGLYPVSCRAAMPSQLCRMNRTSLHRACLAYPHLAMHMLELAGKALSLRIDEVDSLVGCTTAGRLAGYLLKLSGDSQQTTPFELPLSQRHVATKLGIRAETLSRLLSEWQRRGVIAGQRRHWRIMDHGALLELAG